MPVSDGYRELVVDQLGRVAAPIRAKRMFGGVGLYADGLFFALIDEDTVYFKTDALTRPEFEARGMPPFRPGGEGGGVMAYHALPDDVLEDVELLGAWVARALDVARRAKGRTKKSPAA